MDFPGFSEPVVAAWPPPRAQPSFRPRLTSTKTVHSADPSMVASIRPWPLALLLTFALAGCSGGGGGGSDDEGADPGGSTSPGGGVGAGTVGSGPSVGMPTFTIADRWVEGTTTSAGKTVTDRRVAAFEKVTVGATEYNSIRLDSQQQAGIITDIQQWVRASDHAGLKTETKTFVQGQPYTILTTWNPPCVGYQWPLQVGKSWTSSCTATTNGQTTTSSTKYTVKAIESVTIVGGGVFSAYNVTADVTQGGTTTTQTQYYAAKACNVVKIIGEGFVHEVESYSCAKGA